jgi:DNA polymerase elongation subunit (family B)
MIYWEYQDGIKKQLETDMPLYFYVEDKDGEYKTITGKPAKKLEFDRWKKFKEKRDKLREYNVKLYESDISLHTKFICNHYYGVELKPQKQFNIFFLDIEVHLESGFPKPEEAEGKITVISIFSTRDQKYYVLAEKDFDASFIKERHGFEYQKRIHSTEESLLRDFIKFIRNEHPDIISGWNSQDYDVPYIINRAKKILEENEITKISPVDHIREEEVRDKKQGIIRKQYFISGINCIDLMEVYKNYTQSIKSSYSLNSICTEEIGEGKIEYTGTLVDLYNNEWQKYIEYNIKDVELLSKLDTKLGYMSLLISFCYGCKVPLEHYSKTTRVLDGAFISKLIENQIVLPDVNRKLIEDMKRLKESAESGEASDDDLNKINNGKYVGGFVADPEKGSHEWIESFDATSLYPSIMMGWNISPETKLGTITDLVGVEQVYDYISGITTAESRIIPITIGSKNSTTTVRKIGELIKKNNYCLAANGTFYRQDIVGVLPKFVDEWFQKRNHYKKLMIECKKKGDDENAKYYGLLEKNYKILINSVYGYLGTRYSRFYDVDNARAVTLTGQGGLKRTMSRLNKFFQEEWKNSEIGKSFNAENFNDFVIYGDTDSNFSGTQLYTKEGVITIRDFFNKLFNDEKNIYKRHINGKEFIFVKNNEMLPYFDEKNKKVMFGNVDYIYRHFTSKKLFRITTKNGKNVDVTEDHTCVVIDENNKLKEVKPIDIKKGDKVITLLYK